MVWPSICAHYIDMEKKVLLALSNMAPPSSTTNISNTLLLSLAHRQQ